MRVAVNKLLLRELKELSSLEEMSTLHGSSGGESPARPTLALVLNWVDSTLVSPVNSIRRALNWELFDHGLVLLGWQSVVEPLELSLGPGGVHVVSQPVGGLLGVSLLNEGVVLSELLESELVLLGSSKTESEGGNVLSELSLHEGLILGLR